MILKLSTNTFLAERDVMKKLRVLIVDDVAQVRRDLHTLLSLDGEQLIAGQAANGQEALRLVKDLRPQVVVLDLEMPLLDGYQTARMIKSGWPECRVVALTVHDYPAAYNKALQAGVDDFVIKGSPLERLVEAIKHSRNKKG
jgi:two-component system, NarL family, response regulator DesR